jgi:hypothetical protein
MTNKFVIEEDLSSLINESDKVCYLDENCHLARDKPIHSNDGLTKLLKGCPSRRSCACVPKRPHKTFRERQALRRAGTGLSTGFRSSVVIILIQEAILRDGLVLKGLLRKAETSGDRMAVFQNRPQNT